MHDCSYDAALQATRQLSIEAYVPLLLEASGCSTRLAYLLHLTLARARYTNN